MKTQQELTDKCIPEIIKKMCELAEGFEWREDVEFENNFYFSHKDYEWIWISNIDTVQFPLLIHRAVEGCSHIIVDYESKHVEETTMCKLYNFKDYQPTTLTHVGCAMLDCLLEVLK